MKKKLLRAFEAATHSEPYAVLSFIASIGLGVAGGFAADQNYSAAAKDPVAGTAHVVQLEQRGSEILQGQEKLDFDRKTLISAQENIGKNTGSLQEQLDGLQTTFETVKKAEQAQEKRLEEFRNTLLFDVNISEATAKEVYTRLWDGAAEKDYTSIQQYFSPFNDPLAFRDECIGAGRADEMLSCMRKSEDMSDIGDFAAGVGSALGSGAGFLLLSLFSTRLRRRYDTQPADKKDEPWRVPAAENPPPANSPVPAKPARKKGLRL